MASEGPLSGIKVLEVASWMFIPSGGSVLVDWGAEVIKIEHPETGDPQRGLITSGLLPGGGVGVNFMIEQPNRGKKSVALDLSHPDGREALLKLVETADVFLTNYLPHVRQKLKIDTDDIRARNPKIIIARGSGTGPQGPEAHKGGYDGASFWARSGAAACFPENDGWPPSQPTPAFGDVMGGLTTAGAIAAALLKRERTGEPSIVDVSLLGTALWQISPMVVANKLFGLTRISSGGRPMSNNPGVGTYKTQDDRFISLILLQSDKFWDDFCDRLGLSDMKDDPKFKDSAARAENAAECVARIDEAFGSQPLSYWREKLDTFAGVWAPFQTLEEVFEDPQVIANGYLPKMDYMGTEVTLVASPAQFDEQHIQVERAPEHGEHTELTLIDAGYDWDQLAAMKESGAIL